MNCLFCKIVKKEIPAQVVFENEHCLAFRDIAPQAPTHVLIIPKIHIERHAVLPTETWTQMHQAVLEVTAREKLKDYRLVINNGEEAGQTVWHFHMHLLSGRPLSWPPG